MSKDNHHNHWFKQRIIVCILIIITLFVLFMWSTRSKAQESDYKPWGDSQNPPIISDYHYPNDSRPTGSLGFIIHFNNWDKPGTEHEQFWTVPTPYGEFTFRVEITPNVDCTPACPDTVELWHAPEGYTVFPFTRATPEQGATIMDIFKQISA